MYVNLPPYFQGLKGIFYHDDRPDLILKGLESIMKNESWFKRSTMNKAIADLLKLKQSNQTQFAISGRRSGLAQAYKTRTNDCSLGL